MLPPAASLRELVLLTCGHPNSVTSQLSDTRSAVSLQQVVVGPLVPTLSPVSLTREGTAGRLTFKHTPLTVVPRGEPALSTPPSSLITITHAHAPAQDMLTRVHILQRRFVADGLSLACLCRVQRRSLALQGPALVP